MLTLVGSQAERQLEAVATGGRIAALFCIQFRQAVGDVVPMRNRCLRPVHADAVERILATQRVRQRGTEVTRLLAGVQRRQRGIDRIPTGCIGVVLHAGLLGGKRADHFTPRVSRARPRR
ncbi:hypothetical protein D3C73_1358540 [compost metagenome]